MADKTTSVSFRLDPELKTQAAELLSEMGLTMGGAITLFLQQVVNQRKIPFEIHAPDPFYSPENMAELACRKALAEQGHVTHHELIEEPCMEPTLD